MCLFCRNEPITEYLKYSSGGVLNIPQCDKLSKIPSIEGVKGLRELRCADLSNLTSIDTKQCGNSLRSIWIENCPELISIPEFPQAKTMFVINCPKLTSIQPMHNLKRLIVVHCPNLEQAPADAIQGSGPLNNFDRLKIRRRAL